MKLKTYRSNYHFIPIIIFILFFLCSTAIIVFAYQAQDFNWRPPFTVTNTAKPSITIIFDTSNSMHRMAYADLIEKTNEQNIFETYGKEYQKNTYYYGYFDSNATYLYVNATNTESNNGYFEKEINTSSTGWNGNFLNWATMHRIDIMRKVMTGGRHVDGYYEIVTTNTVNRQVKTKSANLPLEALGINTQTIGENIVLRQLPNTRKMVLYKIVPGSGGKDTYIEMTELGNFDLRIKAVTDTPIGVLEKKDDNGLSFAEKARLALFRYYYDISPSKDHKGAKLLVAMDNGVDNIARIKHHINNFSDNATDPLDGPAPLAEALYNVGGYIMQLDIKDASETTYAPKYKADSFPVTKGAAGDPFHFKETGKLEYCTPQNVILITPGESTFGDSVPIGPNNLIKPIGEYPVVGGTYTVPNSEPPQKLQPNAKATVIDTARWMRTSDLRNDLQGAQTSMLYVVHAFGKGDTLLEHAAIFGAFRDGNGDKMPVKVNEKGNKITQNDIQWQLNEIAGGVVDNPVNYFSGEGGTALETAVSNAFDLATRNLMSGTAAAVTSQTRSGTGAVYQALFFPPTDANSAEIIAPDWSGQVHAFFVDSKGNMREDSNNNQILDPTEDKIIKFIDVGNTVLIYRYTDSNGDLILSGNELSTYEEVKLQDIKFLWSTTNWLNSISNTNIGSNRPSYTSTDHNRYIFTFVDSSGYQVPGPGEIQEFQLSSNSPTIDDPKEFASYLTLYESKSGAVGPPLNSDFSDVSIQEKLAKRQVDFIRGRDVPLTIETTSIKDPVRSRTRNNVTWRLGDIVTSSPLIIGAPSANYHIIYNDKTYAEFYQKYKTRRQVVYVGANDGMLHAFNGGFFNAANRSFDKTRTTNDTAFDLGAELWAYVPFNLLPHLRWLMDPEYGGGLHVPYMNLMPRAFDVRIFKKDSPDHPNGWGTILVAGMGVGGGKIEADVNKDGSPDRQMSSAYVIMDVTNPEKAPRLLGEVRLPRLGFTTSSPAIMPMAKANTNSTSTEDQWFLVFGSGPADPNGEAHYKKLEHLTSDQNGQLFIVDLKVLAQESDASKALRVLHNGKFQTAISSPYTFSQPNLNAATTEAGSFVGDPATVDFDYNSKDIAKEFRTDVVYYGTIAGSHDSASGKMYRFLTNNELPKNDDSVTWQQTILTNPNQPIVAAPTIVKDKNNIWVYFGAGRFFDSKDIPQEGDSAQYLSFFGIKDPVANSTNPYSADSVSISDLYNSTRITLQDLGICYTTYTRDCADVIHTDEYGTNSTIGWDGLESAIDAKSGWRLDFTEPWERVLGQASALGGAVFFTSYLPGIDICMVEGQSRLYGLYYKTGTAYFDPIFSGVGDTYATFVGLGKGMATTPTIHVGEGGATAFVQTSSGAILPIDTNIDIGAQTLFWKKNIH